MVRAPALSSGAPAGRAPLFLELLPVRALGQPARSRIGGCVAIAIAHWHFASRALPIFTLPLTVEFLQYSRVCIQEEERIYSEIQFST